MNIEKELELLAESLRKTGKACNTLKPEHLSRFAFFYKELTAYNEKINLTSITDEKDFAAKHIADSLSASTLIPYGDTVCDIGPGGGFPSVPLKIFREDLKFTLFEAAKKKVNFIETLSKKLKLDDFACLHMRAETAAKTAYRESFGTVIARAVAPLNTLLEYALPLVKLGGIFVAYKGIAATEIIAAKNAAKILGSDKPKVIEVILPISDFKRQLVVYRKIGVSPAAYPRKGNKAKLKPL
jgi:16S rRNA (guanine527-N7)-methyltransferase